MVRGRISTPLQTGTEAGAQAAGAGGRVGEVAAAAAAAAGRRRRHTQAWWPESWRAPQLGCPAPAMHACSSGEAAHLALVKPGHPHPAAVAADRHGHAAACLVTTVFWVVSSAIRGCLGRRLGVPPGPLVAGCRMPLVRWHRDSARDWGSAERFGLGRRNDKQKKHAGRKESHE